MGTGRIAIPVAAKTGALIYGVDSCYEMLKQCRKKIESIKKKINLILIEDDIRTFTVPKQADLVYMPFRTIGHLMEKDDLDKLFLNIRNNLKENGIFIFDHYMFNQAWAIEHDCKDILMYKNDVIEINDFYKYDFQNKIMHCQIKVNGKVKARFDFRWIKPDEVRKICQTHGFRIENLYGDFDGSVFQTDSPEQIWVLKKI